MNTKDFIKLVAVKSKIESNTVEKVLNAVTESITDLLTRGISPIYINGFGSFGYRISEERAARNPRTGEVLSIPPTCYSYFRPADQLKQALKEKSIITDNVKQASQNLGSQDNFDDEDDLDENNAIDDYNDQAVFQRKNDYTPFYHQPKRIKSSMPVGVL